MWERIKKILQKEGGQCIILEKDQPTYLVKKLDNGEDVEGVNRDIEEIRNSQREEGEMPEAQNGEVKVEDLPF